MQTPMLASSSAAVPAARLVSQKRCGAGRWSRLDHLVGPVVEHDHAAAAEPLGAAAGPSAARPSPGTWPRPRSARSRVA